MKNKEDEEVREFGEDYFLMYGAAAPEPTTFKERFVEKKDKELKEVKEK
jgi:hypothetical protein